MKSFETKADPSSWPTPKDCVKKCKVMDAEDSVSFFAQCQSLRGSWTPPPFPGSAYCKSKRSWRSRDRTSRNSGSASAFSSWMGLCPDSDISGSKVLWSGIRNVKNRIALTLRMKAQSLRQSQLALGYFYRRMRAKLGAPKASTAAAHKLARIVYHLLTKEAYYDSVFAMAEERYRKRSENQLKAHAQALGFTLVPTTL